MPPPLRFSPDQPAIAVALKALPIKALRATVGRSSNLLDTLPNKASVVGVWQQLALSPVQEVRVSHRKCG
jgi:hypothetical protein